MRGGVGDVQGHRDQSGDDGWDWTPRPAAATYGGIVREDFENIVDAIEPLLQGAECFTCSFHGEAADFVRFNRSNVRQAGAVTQRALVLDLIAGRRHAAGALTLSGAASVDRARLAQLIAELRAMREQLSDDPYLLYATTVRNSERCRSATLPERDAAVEAICRAGERRDLVGIYAAGTTHVGFANSFGQRNWYTAPSFNLDWSFFHDRDRAVKAAYAGTQWSAAELERKVDSAVEQLAALARPARTLPPGRYRVYLAPAAFAEILGVLSWGGFGLRAHRTKTTPLLKMIEDGARLHPGLQMIENTGDGLAPNFQEAGFIRPDRVALVEAGAYHDCLASPRSAAEYGVETNGASASEMPSSIEVGAGTIRADGVLSALHTGLYVSNLWYLNFSDRTACRTTGMTRFATFWVERGVIQAPVEVMRFDETIYRMLGTNLVGLTSERELVLDPSSYGQRSTDSARVPGVLVDDFSLTL
jgi:predicted Zn-dependent protease